MPNKVLVAFVVLDVLFVALGAIQLGFAVIVQNEIKQVPTEGVQAARNLFYSSFPLEGERKNITP